jgi:hypothetical protein
MSQARRRKPPIRPNALIVYLEHPVPLHALCRIKVLGYDANTPARREAAEALTRLV